MISVHIIYLSIQPAIYLFIFLSIILYLYISIFLFSFILYFSLTSSHPPSYLSPPLCKCIFLLSIQLFISLSLSFALFLSPSLSLPFSLFVSLLFPPTLSICFSHFPSDPPYLFISFFVLPFLYLHPSIYKSIYL